MTTDPTGYGGGGGAEYHFGGGGMDAESIFDQIFGGRMGGARTNMPFQDMETMQPRDFEKVVEISLEEIDSGTKRVLTYQTMDAQRIQDGVTTIPTTKKVEVK